MAEVEGPPDFFGIVLTKLLLRALQKLSVHIREPTRVPLFQVHSKVKNKTVLAG